MEDERAEMKRAFEVLVKNLQAQVDNPPPDRHPGDAWLFSQLLDDVEEIQRAVLNAMKESL